MGEVQAVKGAPSRLHSNVEPAAEDEKPKFAVVERTVPDGPEVIVVSGAPVSTVRGRYSREKFPEASSAHTTIRQGPSWREGVV